MPWNYENEYRLITNANSKKCGLMPLKSYCPFLRIRGIIMGINIGNAMDQDAISFIRSVELEKPIRGNDFDAKLKNYIAELGGRYNKEIYLAKISREFYKIDPQKYL